MLITPGSIGYLLTDRFDHMLWISISSSVFSCVMGTYVSYYLDISTGGSIVVLMTLLFMIAMVFAPKYGIIAQNGKKNINQDFEVDSGTLT